MSRIAFLAISAALLGSSGSSAIAADTNSRSASVAAPVPDGCAFISQKDMIGIMAADLDSVSKSRAKGTRYLTLTHLTSAWTKEKFMEVYRQGAVKLINSLSRSSRWWHWRQ